MYFKRTLVIQQWSLLLASLSNHISHINNVLREGRKEGNVLFNDALNTFYFTVIWRRTYGKGPLI